MNRESIDQLAKKLAAAVPQGLKSVRSDLEENFRAVLSSGLSRMDLVTREEFTVQEAVLQRTREKLEALEQRLQVLSEASARRGTGGKDGAGTRTTKKRVKRKKAGD